MKRFWMNVAGPGLKAGAAAAVIAFVAFVAFFGGYFVAESEFERDIREGWYLKNATMWERVDKKYAKIRAAGGRPWESIHPPRAWANVAGAEK